MSASPEAASQHSSSRDSQSSAGFRSFWKNSDEIGGTQNVQFVQQNPGTTRKSIRRSLRPGSSGTTENGQVEEDPEPSAAKRRQQVYQAQKHHRTRKADYVQTLRAEVANTLAHQNQAMRTFLTSQSLDVPIKSVKLSSSSAPSEDLSSLGSAEIDMPFDPEIEHEHTFLDFDMPDMTWPFLETSPTQEPYTQPAQDTPAEGDSWAALDFILALESPCREHHGINPNARIPRVCDMGQFHGHAPTAPKAVALPLPSPSYEHSELLGSTMPIPRTSSEWQLPHSEIDKLVELSDDLPIDDELMTPAQAYSMIRMEIPSDDLRPVLDGLKITLASLVRCSGLGAVMPSNLFFEHLNGMLQTLKVKNSRLG
ncbi:hypothetical protein LTR08_003685 [Meristemomyces frigidus]|nr:hypothetical protein LTR08_003685 [Meristemomyces frigidus]